MLWTYFAKESSWEFEKKGLKQNAYTRAWRPLFIMTNLAFSFTHNFVFYIFCFILKFGICYISSVVINYSWTNDYNQVLLLLAKKS